MEKIREIVEKIQKDDILLKMDWELNAILELSFITIMAVMIAIFCRL